MVHQGQQIIWANYKLDGFDAVDFSYHYTGRDGKSIVYAHLYIIPRGHDAYYLTIESVDQKTLEKESTKLRATLNLP